MHAVDSRILRASLVVAFVLLHAWPTSAEVTLHDIIENVRRHELLYENLDATVQEEFHVSDDQRPAQSSEDNTAGMKLIISRNSRTQFVGQNGLFRLDRTGSLDVGQGDRSNDLITAFDGKITRILDQNRIANVVQDRQEDPARIRPHMMLFAHSVIRCALSAFLSGEAARADPLAKLADDQAREVTYTGEADFKGLKCHVVRVACILKPDTDTGHWELWLAEDRNYLPVRRSDYTYHISRDIAEGEGEVEELREVEPGVWFPFSVRATGCKPALLKYQGVAEVGWEERYVTENVSLHPDYPFHHFHDVPIPDGVSVYEVRGDSITRSYVEGAPQAMQATLAHSRNWIIVINVIIVLAAIGIVLRRSRSSKVVGDVRKSQAEGPL